jgi:amidohydrolase
VNVNGIGGHGSAPHDAIDPIYTAATFITSVQQVVSRQIDPLEPAVVTIGAIHAGTTHNVIPRTCRLLGTVRAFGEDVRAHMPERIERVLRACCDASGASYDFEYLWRYPVTANDSAQTAYARELAAQLVGGERVVEAAQLMGAEDFSFYAQCVPSCFYTLGTSSDESTSHPHHSSLFDIDERALPTGVQMMTALAFDAPRNAP